MTLDHQAETEPNLSYGNKSVVEVTSVASDDSGPAVDEGVKLTPDIALAEGAYYVSHTAQFFDLNQVGSGPVYGITRFFLDGVARRSSWSSDIPDSDVTNAAQSSTSFVLVVGAGGGTLSAQTSVHGSAGNTFQAGANISVLKLALVP